MSRSLWKKILLLNAKKIETFPKKSNKILIFKRQNIILKKDLNQCVNIHNGIRFFEITITEKMLGHTFAEFAPTRKLPLHKKKKRPQTRKSK